MRRTLKLILIGLIGIVITSCDTGGEKQTSSPLCYGIQHKITPHKQWKHL